MNKLVIACLALCSSVCFAAEKLMLVPAPQAANNQHNLSTRSSAPPTKTVALLPVKLSPASVEMQKSRLAFTGISLMPRNVSKTASKVDLGMNGVPVFDQGHHGTCVTFALTAAIDAAISKGDYVSQLCYLQLSNTLGDLSYWSSGWDGSLTHRVMSQLREYGLMTKADQRKGLCNNVKEYPPVEDSSVTQAKMSLENYHRYSKNLLSNGGATASIEPQLLFKLANFTDWGNYDRYITIANYSDGWVTPEESFQSVHRALADGHRVVLGFLINVHSFLAGRNKTEYDTWFLTKSLRDAFNNQNGSLTDQEDWGYHEIVLYGYDDNTIVTSSTGEKQKGVFYVRNSWGTQLADRGVEFMTYDYFKMMALDATALYTSH